MLVLWINGRLSHKLDPKEIPGFNSRDGRNDYMYT